MYDSTTADMHAVLFGGISQYYFYEPDSAVYEDLNVPSPITSPASPAMQTGPQTSSFTSSLRCTVGFQCGVHSRRNVSPRYPNEIIKTA